MYLFHISELRETTKIVVSCNPTDKRHQETFVLQFCNTTSVSWRLATGWTIQGSNPGGGRDFPHPYRPALWPTQPSVQWVPDLCRGLKRPGRDVDHPSPPSAEVKERVELYVYSPVGIRGLFCGELYFYLYFIMHKT